MTNAHNTHSICDTNGIYMQVIEAAGSTAREVTR